MSDQWFHSRGGEQNGPYSWDEVVHYVRQGNIKGEDLLWSQSSGKWLTARQVPGLFETQPDSGKKHKTETGNKSRKKPVILVGAGVLVLLLAAGLFLLFGGDWFSFGGGGSGKDIHRDVGAYYLKDPDPANLVDTADWELTPANQVAIVLENGLDERDAERIAGELGAEVIGYIELINMYQLESSGTTEADLLSLLSRAEIIPGVEIALPNIPVYSRLTLEGRSCSPLNDPIYKEGNNDRAYEMIGLQNAWDIIRASGVELSRTRVGVIDAAVYTRSGHEFTPELHFPDEQGRHKEGKPRIIPLNRDRDLTDTPSTRSNGDLNIGGLGHGTSVTHVIAADSAGGTAGVASILGENLEVLVSTQGSGTTYVGSTDPDDPVRWGNHTYGMLERMLEQVENGATVINCSWGPATLGPQNSTGSAMMRKFLRIMNERYPDVVFVTAAGNSNQGLNGDNDYWGKELPNLITVGALDNDGDRATVTDWHSEESLQSAYQRRLDDNSIPANTSYQQFVDSLLSGSNYAQQGGEITLSASGTGVPVGIGPDGKTLTSNGTSFSSPQVAGAIALMRSINPELTAADIKRILVESASRQVERDGVETTVPENMGAGVLRIDQAVLQVINEMRAGPRDDPDYPKLPPLDLDALLDMSRVFLTAELVNGSSSGGGQEWIVTAEIKQVGSKAADLQLKTSGQGSVAGSTTQSMSAPGQASWRINTVDDNYVVRVSRLDNQGCAILELSAVDLSGTWTGYWMMTASDILNDPVSIKEVEGCEDWMAVLVVEVIRELMNKEIPMTLQLWPGQVEGSYDGSLYIHFQAAFPDEEVESETQYIQAFFENGELSFAIEEEGEAIYFYGGLESSDQLKGTFTAPFEGGVLASGNWSVKRQEE